MMRKLVEGASYGVLAGVAGRIVFSLGSILFARILGAADYGVYVNILAFANFLSVLSLFGVNTAFSVFVPQFVQKEPESVGPLIIAGHVIIGCLVVLTCSAVYFLAPFISETVYRSHIAPTTLQLSSFLLFGIVLNTASMSVLYGFQDFRRYAILNIVSSVAVIVLALSGSYLHGVHGLVIGSGVGYLASAAASVFFINRYTELRSMKIVRNFGRIFRELISFSLPTFLSGLFVAPAYWIGNFLMTQSGDTSSSGYFGVANALAQLVLLIPTLLAAPLIPILSETHAQGDERRFASLVMKNIRIVWLITLPFVALFGTVAGVLIGTLYGDGFAPAKQSFLLLIGVNTLIAIEGVLGNVLIARKKMWDSFAANLTWFLVLMAFVHFLVTLPQGGHIEFSISLLAAYAIFGLVITTILKRHVAFDAASGSIVPLFALTLAVFASVWVLSDLALPSLNMIGVAMLLMVALCTIEWTWFVTNEERALVLATLDSFRRKFLGA